MSIVQSAWPDIPSLGTDWPRIEAEWRGVRLARPGMLER
jgi:hypothetical protein